MGAKNATDSVEIPADNINDGRKITVHTEKRLFHIGCIENGI